jgi:nucleoid DNA-binding protein
MYKRELIRRVAKRTGFSQRAVGHIFDASITSIEETLQRGQSIRLPGFGTFYTRERAASTAVDFKTKQPVKVPAMQVAGFRVGKLLKTAVRTGMPKRHSKKAS